MNNFENVFAANPKIDTLYVVKGQPFVNEKHAINHARDLNVELEEVHREKKDGGSDEKDATLIDLPKSKSGGSDATGEDEDLKATSSKKKSNK